MLTNKLSTFRTYFRSSAQRYLKILSDLEAIKNRYTGALNRLCDIYRENLGKPDPGLPPRNDEWLVNFLPVAMEELRRSMMAVPVKLHSDFLDYHANAGRFRIVIFGKLNSGKSYLANLLAGKNVKGLKQNILTFRAALSDGSESEIDGFEVRPTETTKEIQWCDVETLRLVDLPGVGSISPRNHELAVLYVKKADLVLFLSNSDAVLRGSEFRNIKEDLYGEKKRILFVITQCDMVKDVDTDERIPMKKNDIAEMVKYVDQMLRMPKYGVGDLAKSLDIIPVSARLARLGLEMEYRGDRKRGIGKQIESNIHLLIEKILRIIAEEGRELRLLNPLVNTGNAITESLQLVQNMRKVLDRATVFLRNISQRLRSFQNAASVHAAAERDALSHFLQHRRLRVDLALNDVFSEDGVHRVLHNQQSAEEYITERFEKEIRTELRDRLCKALERWKEDIRSEYDRFVTDCRTYAGFLRDRPESGEMPEKIERDLSNALADLISFRLTNRINRFCEEELRKFEPELLTNSVSLEFSEPVSQMIINGMLSGFGVKFHVRKEVIRKAARTTIRKGLEATEVKALEFYEEQTQRLVKTLQKAVNQNLINQLQSIISTLTQATNDALNTGRRSLEELEAFRKREISGR